MIEKERYTFLLQTFVIWEAGESRSILPHREKNKIIQKVLDQGNQGYVNIKG